MIKKIRIPKERLKILKEVKDVIESEGNVKLEINSEVSIVGDSLSIFNTQNVIIAIGRGFGFDDASKLFKDCTLYVIPISKNKRTLYRIKARIIGKNGKIKKRIEMMTGVKISVYGKTVSIIGKGDELEVARNALERIIAGESHASVFRFLK
ncbi:MAG: KH domain-containing protein [Candidatus Aenigmatarchaeota archaeon]